jgi:hypothetical protein
MAATDRIQPRYPRQVDVNIEGLEICTTNVSVGGVQLACPEMRYIGLQDSQKDDLLPIKLRIPGTQDWVRVQGKIRYADPCDDEYLIGVQFVSADANDRAQWARYIETLSGSKTVS